MAAMASVGALGQPLAAVSAASVDTCTLQCSASAEPATEPTHATKRLKRAPPSTATDNSASSEAAVATVPVSIPMSAKRPRGPRDREYLGIHAQSLGSLAASQGGGGASSDSTAKFLLDPYGSLKDKVCQGFETSSTTLHPRPSATSIGPPPQLLPRAPGPNSEHPPTH